MVHSITSALGQLWGMYVLLFQVKFDGEFFSAVSLGPGLHLIFLEEVPSVCLSSVHLFIHLFICPFIRWSIHLPVRLSIQPPATQSSIHPV